MAHSKQIGIAASILLGMCVTALLLVPMPPGAPFPVPHFDKLVHAILFFCVALPSVLVLPGRWHWTVWIVVVGYSGLMELVQPVFGRGADLLDLLANATGAALAVIAARVYRSKRAKVQQGYRAKSEG